jgi:hypothetical protein
VFLRFIASLRYRHWLAVSASLFALGLLGLVTALSRADGGHLSGLAAACVASALVAVAMTLRTLVTLPDAPRIRVRELETPTLGRPLFPQRRRVARRAHEEWQPTVWSPDEVTPWSPESDLE